MDLLILKDIVGSFLELKIETGSIRKLRGAPDCLIAPPVAADSLCPGGAAYVGALHRPAGSRLSYLPSVVKGQSGERWQEVARQRTLSAGAPEQRANEGHGDHDEHHPKSQFLGGPLRSGALWRSVLRAGPNAAAEIGMCFGGQSHSPSTRGARGVGNASTAKACPIRGSYG